MPDRRVVPAPSSERPDIDRLADTVRRGLPTRTSVAATEVLRGIQRQHAALDELVALAHDTEETLKHADRLADAVEAAEARVAELAETNRCMGEWLEESQARVAELERDLFAARQAVLTEGQARNHAEARVAELEAENERLREEARKGQEPLAHLILDATTILRAHRIARAALDGGAALQISDEGMVQPHYRPGDLGPVGDGGGADAVCDDTRHEFSAGVPGRCQCGKYGWGGA